MSPRASIGEIVVGLASGGALRVAPRPEGVTVVPVDLPEIRAEDVGRAVRDLLSSPRLDLSSQSKLPFVRVSLTAEDRELAIANDAFQHLRMLTERGPGGASLSLEANTQSVLDDARLEVVLGHIASSLGVASADDLAPALAHSGAKPGTESASPKEQAYARAHARAAALARQIRALDDRMTASVVPDWIWVATGVGGVFVLLTAIAFFFANAKAIVVPVLIAAFLGGLFAYTYRSLRELRTRDALQESRLRLREERETARAETAELAETLRKKGLDPHEVLVRLNGQTGTDAQVPTILFRAATSTAEITALGDLRRQVIVFVDKYGLLAGEDYGDAVRPMSPLALEPETAATRR
jgi:hypothetical protein